MAISQDSVAIVTQIGLEILRPDKAQLVTSFVFKVVLSCQGSTHASDLSLEARLLRVTQYRRSTSVDTPECIKYYGPRLRLIRAGGRTNQAG